MMVEEQIEYTPPDSFEEAMAALSERVELLERGGLTLAGLRRTLSECDALLRFCQGELHATEEFFNNTVEKWTAEQS